MARRKTTKTTRKAGRKDPFDYEALGLVLLGVGIFLSASLIPAFSTGELGNTLRQALAGRLGWGSYALLPPLFVAGGLLLVRQPQYSWARMLTGYVIVASGAWLLLVLLTPRLPLLRAQFASGAWGAQLAASLAGGGGLLAYIVALFVMTLGLEQLLNMPPTQLLRQAGRSFVGAVHDLVSGILAWRRQAKSDAARAADRILAQRALKGLEQDLGALREVYKDSQELDSWRTNVKNTLRKLDKTATEQTLLDVREDITVWQDAVRGFSDNRANELLPYVKTEGITHFSDILKKLRSHFSQAFRNPSDTLDHHLAAISELDSLREGIDLDLTALSTRYRRLIRERDLAENALTNANPRVLVRLNDQHRTRSREYHQIASTCEDIGYTVNQLETWYPLATMLQAAAEVLAGQAEHDLVKELSTKLANMLRTRKRDGLADIREWHHKLKTLIDGLAEEPRDRVYARAEETKLSLPVNPRPPLAADSPDAATDYVPAQGQPAQGYAPAQDDANYPSQREYGSTLGLPVNSLLDDIASNTADNPVGSLANSDQVPAQVVQTAGAGNSPTPPFSTEGDPRYLEQVAASADGTPQHIYSSDAAPESLTDMSDADTVADLPLQHPRSSLLDSSGGTMEERPSVKHELARRKRKIDETLQNFRLQGLVQDPVRGPSVTRFEIKPAAGEKISRYANLSNDLALAMAVGSVRIEAPIPGKSVIGLEVPNTHRDTVPFREAIESNAFRRSNASIPLVLGKSIENDFVVGDLSTMPHMLIAGSTGSGKSVAINTLIGSMVFRFLPTDLRLLMIDPKMVELTPYERIPHLIRPVVTNPNDAAGVLAGAVAHMERRYKMMSKIGAKTLAQYNAKARELDRPEMPTIVIIIDELADLMITSPKEVESAIMRLAQMARATGMHLILATQRPSVDILTSLIKVNVPARVAFAVSSGHDSRTILDSLGAERLTGMGDMLYYQPGLAKPIRLQGPYTSEQDITNLSDFLRRQMFDDDFVEAYGSDFDPIPTDDSAASGLIDWDDDKLREAAELAVTDGQASVSKFQRRLSVGHARAGKLMDSLEAMGIVSPSKGSKAREVLVQFEELPDIFGR
ncbi:MAG: DNA translocase FtsK [Deinococcota bacterium]